jgi:competence protein ComEA
MKKSIYLMAVIVSGLLMVTGCGSQKEAVLLESAVQQDGIVSDEDGSGVTDVGEPDGLTGTGELTGSAKTGGNVVGSSTTGENTDGAESSGTATPGEVPGADTLYVFICGAVADPGVYEVAAGSRICDVLELAGGFGEDAGTDYLNLAEPVSDGQKVYVPRVDELAEGIATQTEEPLDSSGAEEASGKININTAAKEILITLPGIGEAKADSIIAYRTEHGGFSSIEEIMEIPGIKEAVFSKIKELITVG